MSRYNKGIIFTNDKCIGCNKCIAPCSILGANISLHKNGKTHVEIDGDKCNHCGKCISMCLHGAREYKDDINEFILSLKMGKKYSLIVDQSFYLLYKDRAREIFGYLKSLGVEKIYDAAFGAEISIWGHAKYLYENRDNPDSAFIIQNCPALINVIELYHPELLDKVIPVHSPMMCTAIYAHKYLGDTNNMVYLGPCISRKDEISSAMTGGNITYSITYKHLLSFIGDTDISGFSAEPDLETLGFGNIITISGGYNASLSKFFPIEKTFVQLDGLGPAVFKKLHFIAGLKGKEGRPVAVDILACQNGCQEGPGISREDINYENIYTEYYNDRNNLGQNYRLSIDPEENRKNLNKIFEKLDSRDFTRLLEDRYKQPYKIPESILDEIFNSMLKTTPEKRAINCNSCGNSTCRNMAIAIAYGYNKKENCIQYMHEQMVFQINTDFTTGLPNRVAFSNAIHEKVLNNPDKTYLVAIFNINKMNIINDFYGTKFGDKVLVKVGQVLSELCGKDGIPCRLGGDNYVVCMEDTIENLDALRELKPIEFCDGGISCTITLRFGVYVLTGTEEDPMMGLNFAQMAMSEITNISTNKNTYLMFSAEMRQKIKREIEISSHLQSALINNEFQLYFQPQYFSKSNNLSGAEALVRWIKPDGTIISPGIFIPIAEKNGFIRLLDKAIWEMVFKSLRKWIDDGITPVPVSINISRVSLATDELIYVISRLKKTYMVPEEYIHFEITESAYMGDQVMLINRINQLRAMGFKIAMDDFGSGYSSLNTLKDMPIDLLKLDMGFLRESQNMDKGGAIISSVVKMAQKLDLVTIAEGVETQDQADFLNTVGIDIFQGYLFSKPIPQSDYEKILSERNELISVPETNRTRFTKFDFNKFYDPNSNENLMFELMSGPACIVELNKNDCSIIRVNSRLIKLLGVEDVSSVEIQRLCNSLIYKMGEGTIAKIRASLLGGAGEYSTVIEFNHYSKNIPVYVKIHCWEIQSLSNDVQTVFVQMEDITQEQMYEKGLELSSQQISHFAKLELAGHLLLHVRLDLKNIRSPIKVHVLSTNESFEKLSGYTRDEVLHWTEKEAFGVIHAMDRIKMIAHIIAAVLEKDTSSSDYVYRARKKNGEYAWVKILVTASRNPDRSITLATNYILCQEKNPEQENASVNRDEVSDLLQKGINVEQIAENIN